MLRPLLLLLNLGCCLRLIADEPGNEIAIPDCPVIHVAPEELRVAIQKAIPLLQNGATGSANERKCFTCHSQALPVIALAAIAKRGFEVDQDTLQRQLQHTWDHLDKGKAEYLTSTGQGGQVMTAGYAMWTLEAGNWKADETTAAVCHYLIEYHNDKNRWTASSQRLPSMGSPFAASYVALRALSDYGTEEQAERIKARRDAAAKWILETEPLDTEDRVFQLRIFPYIDAAEGVVQKSIDALLTTQQADGGWSQTSEMASDAYATGIVLSTLLEVGGMASDHPAIAAGCRYLIDTQLEDGTWHVVTHAKPIQVYYESGFPHGKDQFISITATAWATLALSGALK